jgi:hydrogenase maturation factor
MTLRSGKLPAAVLQELLARVTHSDPRVLVGPRIGSDAAVIDLGGRFLVATTDPVTFAADDVGWYAVNVNANDIACMGARPAWFLATALLPVGAPKTLPGRIFDQLIAACDALGIELVGGHTEVTPGIERPIVVGAMLGEAAPDRIITAGENIRPGDRVLLTKGIAIEGTALLAREREPALAAAGVPEAIIAGAQRMLFAPGISIVPEARAIGEVTHPRLMHDPTEGGLATALSEVAVAARATIQLDQHAAPVLPATRAICDALGLDPMGLLASGALLAIVDAGAIPSVAARLAEMNIACTEIGTIVEGAPRVIMGSGDSALPLPAFERDELARFFDDNVPDERT